MKKIIIYSSRKVEDKKNIIILHIKWLKDVSVFLECCVCPLIASYVKKNTKAVYAVSIFNKTSNINDHQWSFRYNLTWLFLTTLFHNSPANSLGGDHKFY